METTIGSKNVKEVAKRNDSQSLVKTNKPDIPNDDHPATTHAGIVSSEGGRMMLKHPLPPPGTVSKRRRHRPVKIARPRKVLEEEKYAESLQRIITRDYFDQRPHPGPDTSRGPEDGNINGRSLGEFQRQFTSEDNDSFNELLEAENAERRQRAPWLWDTSTKVRRKTINVGQERLMLEYTADKNTLARPHQPRNALMFPPDAHAITSERNHHLDIRQQQTQMPVADSLHDKSKDRTSLMNKVDGGPPTINNFGFVTENTYKPRGYIVPAQSHSDLLRDALLEKKMQTRKREAAVAQAASLAGIHGRITKAAAKGKTSKMSPSGNQPK